MFSNDTKNWLVILKNRNKNWKILTNFWKFSDIFSFFSYLSAQKGNSVFSRSSANFGEDSRSRGVIKSIPRGIEEWKKFRDLEDQGTRNSSCHPYFEYAAFWPKIYCGISTYDKWKPQISSIFHFDQVKYLAY